MKTLLSLLFLSFTLLAQEEEVNPYPQRPPTFSEANARAIYWINLIDQEQFEASWLEASGLVQEVTTQKQWAAAMKQTRSGLGTVRSRKVVSHKTTNRLSGGTTGNFVIIKLQTSYSRKPSAVETITLMTTELPGRAFPKVVAQEWKVVSYNIENQ